MRTALKQAFRSRHRVSKLDRFFNDADREYFARKFRGAILWVGTASVLSFSVIDYAITRDHFFEFLCVRLLGLPVAAVTWLAYRFFSVRRRFFAAPAYLGAAYLGFLLAFLVSRTGYETSFHFTGLVLAVTSLGGQVPWRKHQLPVLFALMAGPYWLTILTHVTNPGLVLANALCFVAASTLAMTFYTATQGSRRRELISSFRLERANRRQKRVIDRKTREGIYLERLASQFSPQVIESIKSGTLNLESRSRREVACIFVDVQGSTSRVSRIDHRNYTELMAAFFEECVKVFLRHDVTVGTFLGDGILAFTNAPTESATFRRNALEACLEILALQERKRRIYFEAWRTEFNIRIGVDAGYATVGFFPSREHGTYTALGETVSLAARLCSRAELNSLAVTKSFLTSVPLNDKSVRIERLSTANDIKGLEGEMIDVFCVRPPAAAALAHTHCPSCEIPMARESEQVGASVFRCPQCGFRDLVADMDRLKRSA